jgi:hypothetical protein
MSRTKDYFTMSEDPTHDQGGICQDPEPAKMVSTDTGSVAFAQMIEQLTRKPELEFD